MQPYVVNKKLSLIFKVLSIVGVLTFILSLSQDQTRTWYAFLVSFFFFTSLSLGGLFFAAIQHVAKAGWSVNVRRIAESFYAFLPIAGALGVLFVGGMLWTEGSIYSWLDSSQVATDSLLQHKAPYLNGPFFAIRMIVFFTAWLILGQKIVRHSLWQDKDGKESHTHRNLGLSIGFIAVFTLFYSLFSVDTLMSLEPHWFSTIYGVYTFAGLFQSTLAFMILALIYLIKKGALKEYVNENHLHDLAKFLFAFTVFWAYIAFSQYMLIWYANLPEETIFFKPRSHGAWLWVSMALLLFKFIVPFFALLPRWAKRNYSHLTAVSILILIMQYVDIYWLAYPIYNEEQLHFSWPELGIFVGMLAGFLWCITRFWARHPIVAHNDPRIHESKNHHVVY